MDRPFIIVSPGRSGSSMIAGLIAKHGVWVGPTRAGDRHNKTGYFENRELKQSQNARFGTDWLGDPPTGDSEWPLEAESIIFRQGYRSGPWMFKTGAFYAPVWDAQFIKVWRNRADVNKSYKRCKFLTSRYTVREVNKIVAKQHKMMYLLPGIDIHSDKVVAGDYTQLKRAIEHIGLEFDPSIPDGFIEKKVWNDNCGA